MSRNRIEPPILWKTYSTFTSDIDLRDEGPGGAATIIRVVDAGSGSLAVHMENNESDTGIVQFDALVANEEILGRFTRVRLENDKPTIFGLSEADLAAAGGFTDGDTITFKVDGGAEETATLNTGDFSDIATPTLAELKTVIEADTTAEVDATGDLFELNGPAAGSGGSLQLTSTGTGNATLFGAVTAADLSVYVGTDTDVAKIRVGWPAQ